MLAAYMSIFIFMVFAVAIGVAALTFGKLLGKRIPSAGKDGPYECGFDPYEDARNVLKVGDSVEAIVVNISRKNGEINISVKAKDSADAADAMKKMAAESNDNSGTTNLGALLKAKLDKPES